MFPYPSGAGLHVGHPLGYIGTDVWGRYLRMTGHNVLHTIGFDAFGLPAEQYAIRTGTHPAVTTDQNIERYRAQLRRLGFGHDERRSVATTDPAFVRWTQWIFTRLFDVVLRHRPAAGAADRRAGGRVRRRGARPVPGGRRGPTSTGLERAALLDQHRLVYVAEGPVNWCPGLGTVLSNEEVTADGRSAIGNFPVFKRTLRQWMMRITAYADRLIDDLDRLDWPESVKIMQRNWIGRSTGARVRFDVVDSTESIEVYTTRPDTLFGATYVVLAPEHPLVDTIIGDVLADGDRPPVDRERRHPRRGGRRVPPRVRPEVRPRPAGEPGEDRRLRRCVGDQPGERRGDPDLRRGLRADGLRDRRDHGRPRAGHPGHRVRPRLRSTGRPDGRSAR